MIILVFLLIFVNIFDKNCIMNYWSWSSIMFFGYSNLYNSTFRFVGSFDYSFQLLGELFYFSFFFGRARVMKGAVAMGAGERRCWKGGGQARSQAEFVRVWHAKRQGGGPLVIFDHVLKYSSLSMFQQIKLNIKLKTNTNIL